MSFSSQAGLASFTGVQVNRRTLVDRAILEITTPSGIIFTARVNEHGQWSVIGVDNTKSAPAHAIVGMQFEPGADPHAWPQGYAQLVQQGINRHLDELITEVPL